MSGPLVPARSLALPPRSPVQSVGISSLEMTLIVGLLATLTISATEIPRAADSLHNVEMLGLAEPFSTSTNMPLLIPALFDKASSDSLRRFYVP